MVCKNCGSIEFNKTKKTFSNGTHHVEVRCKHCDRFIKWERQNIPLQNNDIMYFGKYKGKTLIDIAREDTSYLEWISEFFNNENYREKMAEYLEKNIYNGVSKK